MNKPRVCIIVDPSVLTRHHGVRRYLLSLASALREGYEVHVYNLAVRLQTEEIAYTRLYWDLAYENNNGFGGNTLAGTRRRQILDQLVDLVREENGPGETNGLNSVFVGPQIPGDFDLVLVGAPWAVTPGLSLPMSKRTYLIAYDAIPSQASMKAPEEEDLGSFAYQHIYGYGRFLEHHDGILAISEESAQQCRALLGAADGRILALPSFLPAGFEALGDLPSRASRRIVLAAPFDVRKGFEGIPEMLRGTGVESLAIFGGVRCEAKAIRQFFEALEIEEVEWWSSVDFKKQVELYASASVLLFPSRHEGLGLPVLEAYACGTPALVTDISPLRDLVIEAEVLLPDPTAASLQIRRALDTSPPPQVYRDHARSRWGGQVLRQFVDALLQSKAS